MEHRIIPFLWQLPQNVVGLLVCLFTKAKRHTLYGYDVRRWRHRSGLSLGRYIFVDAYASEDTVRHEHGHQVQSLLLGWLYLPVIGLSSLLWASLYGLGLFHGKPYRRFFTERWADRLAGIGREEKR